ncbi:MAG: translesion error-prone DNA polymerase V autoproteolytic subunit [Chitinophagaceae bacterium]|nr:translesion error-prone DNA polymerase V autoproteolytic subunit [Chitinophagaceae bacterium]
MQDEMFYNSVYDGTKKFQQKEVLTANATGFGAAADDFMERGIDLNERLIMNKPATFFFRMNSDAMENASIHVGDVLIVDRSIKATNGKIIVAAVNGELFVRRYSKDFNTACLSAENKKFKDITLDEFTQFISWGVVTCVIHMLDASLMAFNKKKTL